MSVAVVAVLIRTREREGAYAKHALVVTKEQETNGTSQGNDTQQFFSLCTKEVSPAGSIDINIADARVGGTVARAAVSDNLGVVSGRLLADRLIVHTVLLGDGHGDLPLSPTNIGKEVQAAKILGAACCE
jgi:hypothetical protein